MRKTFLFLVQVLMVLSLVFAAGCDKDEPLVDPDTPVKDPAGTLTANILETTSISLSGVGSIQWIDPDNFDITCTGDYSGVSICNLGEMKGLGNITDIPQTGFTDPAQSNTTVACETGHGYVIKFEGTYSVTQYVRLYVEDSIFSIGGEIRGAQVKYHFIVEPAELTVSKDSLTFTLEGEEQTILVTTNASDWTYSCDASWISLEKKENTLSISVQKNDNLQERMVRVFIRIDEQQEDIVIKQAGTITATSAPYAVGDLYNGDGVLGIVYQVTEDGVHGMIVSLEETSCSWSTEYITTGCSDISNGMNNMNTIKSISGRESEYPAFKWCDDLNTENISGWYLPAKDELDNLYKNRETVNILLAKYGVQLSSNWYWSSSEIYSSVAWYQSFSSGSQGGANKYSAYYRVRAVRAF